MSKAYYQKHKAEILFKTKRYQQTHQEAHRKYDQKYRDKKRHWLNERARARYHANLEHYRKMGRARAARYPERLLANNAIRRARKLTTQVDPEGILAWMKEIRTKPFVRCHWCGTKISGLKVHFDHIVSLAKGGTHTIGNICASCADCNFSKNARAVSDWICQGQSFLNL